MLRFLKQRLVPATKELRSLQCVTGVTTEEDAQEGPSTQSEQCACAWVAEDFLGRISQTKVV